MANYKGGATTICPYYMHEAEKSITCQGAIEGCNHAQRFDTKQAKEDWQDKICSTHGYIRCPIAKTLETDTQVIDIKPSDKLELDIYNFIIDFATKNLAIPNIREIASATYCSKSTVHRMLWKLDSMGLIEVEKKQKRSIKLKGYELRRKKI